MTRIADWGPSLRAVLSFPAILLAAIAAFPASAQTPEVVKTELAALVGEEQALDLIMSDLGVVAASLDGAEYRRLNMVFAAGLRVQKATIALRVLTTAYTNMADQRDIDYMRSNVSVSCKYFLGFATAAVVTMDEHQEHAQSPKLIAGIVKARDIIDRMTQANLCTLFPEHKS